MGQPHILVRLYNLRRLQPICAKLQIFYEETLQWHEPSAHLIQQVTLLCIRFHHVTWTKVCILLNFRCQTFPLTMGRAMSPHPYCSACQGLHRWCKPLWISRSTWSYNLRTYFTITLSVYAKHKPLEDKQLVNQSTWSKDLRRVLSWVQRVSPIHLWQHQGWPSILRSKGLQGLRTRATQGRTASTHRSRWCSSFKELQLHPPSYSAWLRDGVSIPHHIRTSRGSQ